MFEVIVTDNFGIIYKILRTLERSMELEEFDGSAISAERLGIAYPLWCRIMKMLVDNGYVTGRCCVERCRVRLSPGRDSASGDNAQRSRIS